VFGGGGGRCYLHEVHLVNWWLRHYAASRRVSGSIPRGFFPKLPTEPSALRSTQPLKMSTRKTPRGKDGRCVRVTTLPPSFCLKSRKCGSLNLPEPQGPAQACSGRTLPLPLTFNEYVLEVVSLCKVRVRNM
jgi:hypothetical protein